MQNNFAFFAMFPYFFNADDLIDHKMKGIIKINVNLMVTDGTLRKLTEVNPFPQKW